MQPGTQLLKRGISTADSVIVSRSKHTDPKLIRAIRRIRSPHDRRKVGDLGLRRKSKQGLTGGVKANHVQTTRQGQPRLRVIVQQCRAGFLHPAGKRELLDALNSVGPAASYGLRSIELARAPSSNLISAPVFGKCHAPGRILLFEQPLPPWRLPGIPSPTLVRRFERSGAIVKLLADVGATLVDWPQETLRRFMLEDVLLHELGHHVLQHYKGKRTMRIARTRDHEAFANRFAEKHRSAVRGNGY